MYGQPKWQSVIEACFNTLSGVVISVIVGVIIYPMFGYEIPVAEVTGITLVFTAVSFVRSLAWRRLFNWLHVGGWDRIEAAWARLALCLAMATRRRS